MSKAGLLSLQSFKLSSRRVVHLLSRSTTAAIDHGPLSLHGGLSLSHKLDRVVHGRLLAHAQPQLMHKEVAVPEEGKIG